mmetsp:Transcript_22047/g.70395  ORF Transcript_22047/g.70395 Transcript_22047/m.70395 type:complete len:210 (-) Transcript_22047:2328-2957(-)
MFEKGGHICASSMAVMPAPQMSTLVSYLPSSGPDCESVSGAIQCGVPIIVPRFDMVCCSCATMPRSASLTVPSEASSTLAALMSRWITLRSTCMYSSARRTPRQMPATHGSSKPRPTLRITSRVEPASQNSITTHSVDRIWYSRTKASLYATMCSQVHSRMILISRLMSSAESACSSITLTATSSSRHEPRKTEPYVPCPIRFSSVVSR